MERKLGLLSTLKNSILLFSLHFLEGKTPSFLTNKKSKKASSLFLKVKYSFICLMFRVNGEAVKKNIKIILKKAF